MFIKRIQPPFVAMATSMRTFMMIGIMNMFMLIFLLSTRGIAWVAKSDEQMVAANR